MSNSSLLCLAVVLALIPTLVDALLIWWLDRYEKEPLSMLLVAFLWGALPAIGLAIALEVVASLPLEVIVPEEGTRQMAEIALIAPVVEEIIKAVIVVIFFIVSWREFDNVMDGIIYGAMVGLGFAFVENVFYLVGTATENTQGDGTANMSYFLQVWLLRSILFGLNHSMFTAFTGAALGLARSLKGTPRRVVVFLMGLTAAILLHSMHNALVLGLGSLSDETDSGLALGNCLTLLVSDWGGLFLILVVALGSSLREGHVIRETLQEEVSLGRITPAEYAVLSSGLKRWSSRWEALFSSGFERWRWLGKFFDLATELAFRKHRFYEVNSQRQAVLANDIARLRWKLDRLRHE